MKILTYLMYGTLGVAVLLGMVSIFYTSEQPTIDEDVVILVPDTATTSPNNSVPEDTPTAPIIPDSVDETAPAMLGVASVYGKLTVTPIKVLQDSRCPIDVTCIQAGTVVLEAMVDNGLNSVLETFTLGTSLLTTEGHITLQRVEPSALSTEVLAGAEYRFYFVLQP